MDRARVAVPCRDAPILRLPDGEAQDARRGHRGRVHRPRDGGESRPSRLRRHPRRDARPDPGAARPGDGARRGGLRGAARPAPGAQRRGVRVQAGRKRIARGSNEIGQGVPGGHRDPLSRRAAGHRAGEGGRPRDRGARRDPRRRSDAHEQPGHLCRRRRHRGQGLRHGPVEPHRAGRAGKPPGTHRGRCDRRARLALPGHPGHLDHRALRRGGGLDRRQRKDAQPDRRQGFREGLPLPEFPRGVLPRGEAHRDEGPLPEIRRTPPRRAGARRGQRGQAHQRARRGDPDGRNDLRSRGSRALLFAPVRKREGPRQLRGDGRSRRPARRHADHSLG